MVGAGICPILCCVGPVNSSLFNRTSCKDLIITEIYATSGRAEGIIRVGLTRICFKGV